MKKYLIFIVICLLLSSCTVETPPRKAVTFMVYMAADNSLSEYALADIDEMERSSFDVSRCNVIVQADLSEYDDNPACRRWQIMPDGLYDHQISSPVIGQLGEIDSGDWHSLVSFYNWCITEFPADRYVLSIWSHGNDWYSYPTNPNKFCPDSESGSFFNITAGDLHKAFAGLKENPDLVILDACHMQSVEVISEIIPDCNYICGSTDIVPNSGFPYAEVITEVCNSLFTDYCSLPEFYVSSYEPGGTQNPTGAIHQAVNASLIKTGTFSDSILSRISQLVDFGLENPEVHDDIMAARAECLEFNDLEIDVDLIQLCSKLSAMTDNQELSDIAAQISCDLIASNDFYNYPAWIIGNVLITFPEIADSESWMNLQNDFQLLRFDQFTGWSNLINELIPPVARQIACY